MSFFLGSVSFGLDRGIFYSDFCSAFTKAHGFCHVTRSQLETCTFHGICRLQLIRSATGHFCSLFVQQMRSCSAPESVHQTQVFSVLLAFLSTS